MRRVGGWLHARSGNNAPSRSMTALDEQNALQEALAAAALIMNDDIEQAELELSKGNSPFHKIGRATALFMRATLGFEKEVMEAAGTRIAEAEESSSEYHRRALRDPATAHQSAIYPVGAEYALCHAQTQLMSAVVAVLNESVTESLRGFYKLRKAFGTLSEIVAAEDRYLKSHHFDASQSSPGAGSSFTTGETKCSTNTSTDDSEAVPSSERDEDQDLEFVDAEDVLSAIVTPLAYGGHLEFPDLNSLSIHDSISEVHLTRSGQSADLGGSQGAYQSRADEPAEDIDFRTITSDPIDLFIHSTTALCFGLLQLILSMIPPSFARILSIFSFRGDRDDGFRLLWSATRFKDTISGAMAGLIYLGFHNGAVAFCDILSKGALPEARLRSLLAEMRETYPKSKLWLLEESRMLARDRRLEDAVDMIANGQKSSLKQVEALGVFETSLNLMYLHRYQDSADSFIKCVGLNNWSPALYYYIAGACYIELYRTHKSSDPDKASEFAAKARKYFLEVPMLTQKKRFMGRQLPFDVFTARKITKWETRAKNKNCDLVDAVGVSPVVEMIYFWNGFSKMRAEQLEACLARLAWSDNVISNPDWESEAADEQCAVFLLRAVCQRNAGEIAQAKSTLTKSVLSQGLDRLKAGEHPDLWPLPVGHYEMAVCHWKEAGGEVRDRAMLQQCSNQLAKVERWESFELETRVGLKVTTARETLRKCGVTTT